MEPIEPTEPTRLRSINYIGPSMNPTLRAGDKLQFTYRDGQKIRRGDVVVFIPPGDDSKIIHRVVSVSSNGIKTRGDNCDKVDPWVLSPEHIVGRVVFAQREKRRRRVFGGTVGQLFRVAIRAIHAIDSGFSFLLHPVYKRLSRSDIFRQWLPSGMRPRVISFNREAGTELQLVMGRRVIGRRLEGKTGWHIRRPYRLFVDEAALPENPAKGAVVDEV